MIRKYKQHTNYDCLKACIYTILKYKKLKYLPPYQVIKIDGIYTIDATDILLKYKIPFKIYTGSLNISPYIPYRITKKILQNKDHIEKKSFSQEEFIDLLKNYKPLILCVDMRYITCYKCGNRFPNANEYCGHYITVIGYETETKSIIFLDSGKTNCDICICSIDNIEIARKASGTDEDIIIFLDKKNPFN